MLLTCIFVGYCHYLKTNYNCTGNSTVLYFLMVVFSYSMFYRLNCIIFTFSIGSFFLELRQMGEGLGQLSYIILRGRVCETVI